MTHPLEVPAFLKRGKDNKVPKVKVKAGTIIKRDQAPATSPLDSLSEPARALAEAEIRASRARLHWFADPATCEHYERLATTPKVDKTPHEAKVKVIIEKKRLKEGMVSIATIAKELKIIPRIARAALRGAKVKKPDLGWHFATDEVKHIKETITSWISKQQTPTSRKSSDTSARATPKKTSGTLAKKSTSSRKKRSVKSAKTSGSSAPVARTARSTGTKAPGPTSGTKLSSSTKKPKRK